MNSRIETLALIRLTCWQMLEHACREPDHEWRTLALATVAGSGAEAHGDVRTVVLREVDVAARVLTFFTDSRSPKVAQIRRQPRATLMAWSESAGWQLRLRCWLEIETTGLAVSSRWARLKMTPAAQDYLSPLAPGEPLDSQWSPLTPARATRESFAVVSAQVEAIDWLELHVDGHRRAIFDARGERWVSP
jgi:pyridoxamine 5'-phosphate oxidase